MLLIVLFFRPEWFSPYSGLEIDYIAVLFFLVVLVLLDCYPIRYKGSYYSLTTVVILFVFLQYGLFIEIILTQVSHFVSVFLTQRRGGLRQFLVHLMYVWMSIMSAAAFYITLSLVPNQLGFSVPIVAMVAYCMAHFFGNHYVLNWVRNIQGLQSYRLVWDELKWSFLITLLAVPAALSYIAAYETGLDIWGLLIVSIPIIIVSFIFKLVNDIDIKNDQMHIIHRITKNFTSELDLDKSLDELINAVSKLILYDTCYVFKLNEAKDVLTPLRFHSKHPHDNEEMMAFEFSTDLGLSGQVAHSGKSEYVTNVIEKTPGIPQILTKNKSVLSVPLKVNDKVIGVITLGSHKETGFTQKDLTVVEILASYAATAINNAKKFHQTEKQAYVDELTGLYNYRGFEVQINELIKRADEQKGTLSLLILDIDHFKQINDQFGHVMGNNILQRLAVILTENIRSQDIVCRYGGEEFIVILPFTNEEAALKIAERIRETIASTPFKITNDLTDKQEIFVRITVSMGVAIYPKHAEDTLTLIRNADRAMYLGAKQAGRNKVARYEVS